MAEERNIFGLTQDEVESEMKLLENSYKMYEKTKKETRDNMKSQLKPDGTKMYNKEQIEKRLTTIERALDDIVEKYVALGGDKNNLGRKKRNNSLNMPHLNNITEAAMSYNSENSALDIVRHNQEDINSIIKERIDLVENQTESLFTDNAMNYAVHENGFDVIPLPSKGQCYPNKMDKIPVAPLCAYDENMIVSPNLYKDNLVLDYILKAKVLNNEIDPQNMLEGDREAILLYLRRDGYGDEYPITATDNETGQKFETVIDLSQLKFKPFNLVSDVNGWFDFTLPTSKKVVKFKYLTHKENEILKKTTEMEESKQMKIRLETFVSEMDTYIENDKDVDKNQKVKIRQAIRTIEGWKDGIDDEDVIMFNHYVTNRLEMQVMSVDGVTDRAYIRDFVLKLNVKDARALRQYISDNEPGVDYRFTVKKPESLGGGSTEAFLQFDKYLFLNIS